LISSNDPILNRNITFLDRLKEQPEWKGSVAAVGSWDVIEPIINRRRSEVSVIGGKRPPQPSLQGPRWDMLRRLVKNTPTPWHNVQFDAMTHEEALLLLETMRPQVMFVSYGETDEWAHQNNYPSYLLAAHQFDLYVSDLWQKVQSLDAYRDKTTFIITTDHGRGATTKTWQSHGGKLPESDRTWLAALGPDTPAVGDIVSEKMGLDQVAATVFKLLGLDYAKVEPRAALPLEAIFKH
jgi:hypothetical protein